MKKILTSFIILSFLTALFIQAGSESALAYQPSPSSPIRNPGQPAADALEQTLADVKSFSCDDVTVVPVSECQALVDLYASTNGAGWITATNWLSDPNISTWFGITVSDGHVTIVSLYSNDLDGTVQETIGQLSYLRLLELAGNQITGPIPAVPGVADLPGRSLLYEQSINRSYP